MYGGAILQGILGFWVRHREINKLRKLGQVGLKAMLHAWFGRGLIALGLAQIPLGLFVYGSPLVFFIIYAVFMFLIFVAWFILEYVHNRRLAMYQPAPGGTNGTGANIPNGGVASVRGGARSEGSSHHRHGRHQSHSGISYTEMTESTHPAATTVTTGTFDTRTSFDGAGTEYVSTGGFGNDHNHSNMPASPKMSRLNRLSQSLGNRFRRGVNSLEGRVIGGTPISLDASTRPATGSTANRMSGPGGLHAPPSTNRAGLAVVGGRIAAVGDLDQHHFRRTAGNDPLRDSSSGRRPGGTSELPGSSVMPVNTSGGTTTGNTSEISPVSPVSSAYVQMPPIPRPQSEVSSQSSDRPGAKYAGGHLFSPLLPPIKQHRSNQSQDTTMPPSPLGDAYQSDDDKYPRNSGGGNRYPPLLPPATTNPPRVPLPMPPEPHPSSSKRSRSHNRAPSDTSTQPDAVIRIPLHRNSDTINIPAGELIRNNLPQGEQPQVSVQVKVDRLGRSVTVRRLPEDEASLVRQVRQRERAQKAEERERAIDAAVAAGKRRSDPVSPPTASGSGGGGAGGAIPLPPPPPPPLPPLAKASASTPLRMPAPYRRHSYSESDDDYTSDEAGYARGGGAPIGIGGSAVGADSRVSGIGRESVVSAGAQTDEAEAEEKIRERRRKKRREERKEGGLTSAELHGGTYYGGGTGGSGGVEWT